MANLMLNPGGPRFNPGKLFIKPKDKPEADWQEVSNGLVASDFIVEERGPEFIPIPECGRKKIVLNFVIHLKESARKRMMLRIKQEFGLAAKPKCTYKTIRRDCAKRNKYKR